ncbi:HNH endonuclease [Ralstonia pseudosolanacearum]|uniref:HNH endonuclease signature motif containing protein n=1 Tax=Ralstonia pseudosolanacearum TaxID=1310165 RepID=UPI0014037A47|nr:HNH endonuclease signature motif containing protein [Ralstonia pseudosolanacearum]KAF3462074.1 HNH endonuclease [Ralstonia solanacearum]NKA77092.1 HNH endonuclease [Ralstonia solanacearum]NKG00929.1 HNH endonuclease [Ralstonia solanacearum]NKG05607.1 HNH endonuclease [Ralstonia solanacearum]QKL91667.1 HNH endonuclease [Ralstonia solanacearum]
MEIIERIRRLTSLEEIEVMRDNAKDAKLLTPDIDAAFRDRTLDLYVEKVLDAIGREPASLQAVEAEVVAGLAALWMTSNRPNYSIRAVRDRKSNLIQFASDTVSKLGKSQGYRRLMDNGFGHLVFERIVIAHPEVFSETARAFARSRLDDAESGSDDDPAGRAPKAQANGRYSTNALLEAIGFHKPTPYEWYALRRDEIVHLAWVEDADFQQGYALVFERKDDDRRPTYTHWRKNVQRIMDGEYSASYIVFGYRGTKDENQQLSNEVVLYRMSNFQEVGGNVYASITAAPASTDDIEKPDSAVTPPGRKYALMPVRPEQAAFRRALFGRFDGRCAITGCQVAQLLDAAHLPGRDWAAGDNDAADGILLRADLHRALDSGLIRLDAQLRLAWVAPIIHELYGHLLAGEPNEVTD